ncbi:MAG: tRNA preQ1(34) S-adenosylmethionine ribosyltransferase-isomerase QueA [Campylobacteraceae bacterium]|nr:tRNA preQ1(34) S-adenosylmethionine ribosyltransferase-isomerase QueA [Campylobacteraceae bacterium]
MYEPFQVSAYDYFLPEELIASYPEKNRNDARVLVYDRKKDEITHTTFGNIFDFFPSNVAVVINDTKVVKARIYGKKNSGGKVELLLNSPLQDNLYSVYIKGRIKKDTKLQFDNNLNVNIKELKPDGSRIVEFFQNEKKINTNELFDILEEIGHIPLPPYIKRQDSKEDINDYQSIFAKNRGAVAAPTASLHFSSEKFDELQQKFTTKKLTLHVGAGTFKPVTCENISEHKMHSEFFSINKDTAELIKSNKTILAVGTTVTRSVEYCYRHDITSGYCDLFLHPKNKPLRVNHLLTNFHLPKSTLIMLVASFIGIKKTLELYKVAVREKYRFFSYGDAMLII